MLIVRGVEPGITQTCPGVYKAYIFVIVSLRVCSGPQQTRSFSAEFTTKRKFQHSFLPIAPSLSVMTNLSSISSMHDADRDSCVHKNRCVGVPKIGEAPYYPVLQSPRQLLAFSIEERSSGVFVSIL